MSNSANRRNAIEHRRQLHARIARSRRRIGQQTSHLAQGFLPLGWRRQVQEHPVMALATAAGAGALLAQVCSQTGAAGKSADWLAQWLAGGTWTSLMKQLEQFLAKGEPPSPAAETEPEDA